MYKTSKCLCIDKIAAVHMRNVKFTPLIFWLAFQFLFSWWFVCLGKPICACYSCFILTWSCKKGGNLPCFHFLYLSTHILQNHFHLYNQYVCQLFWKSSSLWALHLYLSKNTCVAFLGSGSLFLKKYLLSVDLTCWSEKVKEPSYWWNKSHSMVFVILPVAWDY